MQPENCLRETILPSTLAWLRDPTWAVRDCACRSLARLLSACPKAANDAIMGVGGGAAAGSAAAAGGGGGSGGEAGAKDTPPSTTTATTTPPNAANSTAGAAGSSPDNSNAAVSGGGGDMGGTVSIATLTANASARGLKALATDPNYHLRQIFIQAVQVRQLASEKQAAT